MIKLSTSLITACATLAFAISAGLGDFISSAPEGAVGDVRAFGARPGSKDGIAETRLAIVIANARYRQADAPLAHPIGDARALADQLRRNGFTVQEHENLRTKR